MSQLYDLLQNTADAIRKKNGNGFAYSPSQFEEGILSIPNDLEDKYIPISYIGCFGGGLGDFIEVVDLSNLLHCEEINGIYDQQTTSENINSTHTTIYLPNHDNEIILGYVLMNWSMTNYKQVELHARKINIAPSLFHMRGGNDLVFLLDYDQMTTRGVICDCSQGTTIRYWGSKSRYESGDWEPGHIYLDGKVSQISPSASYGLFDSPTQCAECLHFSGEFNTSGYPLTELCGESFFKRIDFKNYPISHITSNSILTDLFTNDNCQEYEIPIELWQNIYRYVTSIDMHNTYLNPTSQYNIDSFYTNLYDRKSNSLSSINLILPTTLSDWAADSGTSYSYIGQRLSEYGYTVSFK